MSGSDRNRDARARDRLREALAELPSPPAGEDFTARVLRRLHETPPRRSPRVLLLAAAAVAAALLLVPAARYLGAAAPRAAGGAPARAEKLAEEQRRIARELAELRKELEQQAPVVYLGGDSRIDLVLDLGSAARHHPSLVTPAATPPHSGPRPVEDRR